MKNHSLFVHFSKEEQPFVERVFDWLYQVKKTHHIVTTPFLDPRERVIIESLVNREDELEFQFHGGHLEAERKRAVIFPDYVVEVEKEQFAISYLRVVTASQNRLTHPEVLGALLGLGIKREMIGDIYPHETGADFVTVSELKPFFLTELQKIGRERVRIEEIEMDDLTKPDEMTDVKSVTVSSLRIDVVLSAAHRLSRTLATKMIKSGKAKRNWRLAEDPAITVETGDIISLRKYGRIRVLSNEGFTKKGKIVLKLGFYS